MNDYTISDISIGMKESFFVSITDSMMHKFLDITSDENPLHLNEDFARQRGFNNKVVYGMLTASMISTLGGCYLPGRNCLIQGIEIKFVKPVYVGDVLEVIGEVSKVDYDLRYLEIKVTIKNQNDQKVLRGLLRTGVIDA
ncbi:MaoC family dehydratase [Solobacterium sp.]|jgi:putative phosphate acetyltransferase|uniref:MaoC family dehydratase n=1 Tax=Solobacterium sp. TaxID=2060878 RepID=UPI001CAFB068|nr:MaoC family dehydratase [Solobacterium sp.]MBF1100215.1 MaoC family dehydratase [Solobacterium sp.]